MTLTLDWLNTYRWPATLLTGHPLAIAHRGASDYAPENTLKAFQIAADLCAEMWELDVRLSADGVCVVAHDDNLTRVAGRELKVSEATWGEIKAVRLPEGQHIPRLEEVIALAAQTGCGLYIEIKGEGAGPVAWQLLQEAGFTFATLASFCVPWMHELRALGCNYPLGVLVPAGAEPLTYLDGLDAEIVHLCWRDASAAPHELLTPALLAKLAHSQIVIWDEDRTAVLNGLRDKPLMGICSNRPELLKPYPAGQPIEIVCHRGANWLAPENTLEAARICLDQRFQYVELDVRTTKDGVLVVIHDADLLRTSGFKGLVIDHTLAEIQALDAGGWFRDEAAGYRVPTLADFLALAKGKAGIYIEIKHADPAALLEVVRDAGMLDAVFFWGADTEGLRWLRAQSDQIILMAPRWLYGSVAEAAAAYGAQIIEFDVEKDAPKRLPDELKQCQDLGLRSMIFSTRGGWDDLAYCLSHAPDMVNLDHPDRFKILAAYPLVRQHFGGKHRETSP